MKLIEQNDKTVTLRFTRQELKDLHNALGDAMYSLEGEPMTLRDLIEQCEGIDDPEQINNLLRAAGRAEGTVKELQQALERAKRFFPKINAFRKGVLDLDLFETEGYDSPFRNRIRKVCPVVAAHLDFAPINTVLMASGLPAAGWVCLHSP